MTDDLAARRAAVAARLAARRQAQADARVVEDCRASIEQIRERADLERFVAAAILRSRRAHPSNQKPYDQETET